MSRLTKQVVDALSQPFPAKKVQWRQNASREGSAQALAYIEARDVMQRLDEVVGGDWEFTWEIVGDAAVKGRLTVCGVTREDVGEMGSGPMGKTLKTAVSDALKRCAVHFGIGRYLYYLPTQYVPTNGKRFARDPELPEWAIPWTPMCEKAFSSPRTIVPRKGPSGNGNGHFDQGPARPDEAEEPMPDYDNVPPADTPEPFVKNEQGTPMAPVKKRPKLTRSQPKLTYQQKKEEMAPWESEYTPAPDIPPTESVDAILKRAYQPTGDKHKALRLAWMDNNKWFHGELRRMGINHDQGKAYMSDVLDREIEHFWDTGLSPADVINVFRSVAEKAA